MRVLATTLVLLLTVAPAALAQSCPRTSLGDIEDEVMCPVCGTSLALASEAPQAERQREFIERRIADCQSKDEIKDALAAEFGDEVLALPGDEGFELAAYLIPVLAILAAAAGIGVGLVRWRRRGGADLAGAGSAALGASDEQRLDDDLARYDL